MFTSLRSITAQHSVARPASSSSRSPISIFHQLTYPSRHRHPVRIRPHRSATHPRFASSSSNTYRPAEETLRTQLFKSTTLVLICVPILTGFLGVWQIKRLRWKVALIDEIERNLGMEPLVLPGKVNLSALPDFAFRRVHLSGTLSSPAILLGPRVYEGVPGWELILPLIRDSSNSGIASTVLLNRGFISNTQADSIRTGQSPPPGLGSHIEVDGMLAKASEQAWSPDNKPEQGQWFWKDVEAMKEWVGGEGRGVQAVLVDAIEDLDIIPSLAMQRGEPIGKPAIVEIRNQHASYAATWFSLSAATSAMLVFLLRRKTPSAKFGKRR